MCDAGCDCGNCDSCCAPDCGNCGECSNCCPTVSCTPCVDALAGCCKSVAELLSGCCDGFSYIFCCGWCDPVLVSSRNTREDRNDNAASLTVPMAPSEQHGVVVQGVPLAQIMGNTNGAAANWQQRTKASRVTEGIML